MRRTSLTVVIFNTLRMNERILVFALAGSRVIVAAVILYQGIPIHILHA